MLFAKATGDIYAMNQLEVAAIDPQGNLLGEVSYPGVGAMIIHGTKLYASNAGADEVKVFDIAGGIPSPVATWHVPSSWEGPRDLAFANGRLFVSVETSSLSGGAILEVTDGSDWTDASPLGLQLSEGPTLFGMPGTKNLIVDDYLAGIADCDATVPLTCGSVHPIPNAYYLIPAPLGDGVIGITGDLLQPPFATQWDLPDLNPGQTYGGGSITAAIGGAASPATDRFAYAGGDSLFVYEEGSAGPAATYNFEGAVEGLAFGADGNELYVVWSASDLSTRFSVINPNVSDAQLSISASDLAPITGDSITLTAHLVGGSSNKEVTFFEKAAGQPKTPFASGPVDASGDLSVTVKIVYDTDYWATYAGDPLWNPAVSPTVSVTAHAVSHGRMLKSYGTQGVYKLYHRDRNIYVKVWTDPLEPGQDIDIGLQYRARTRWKIWDRPDAYRLGRDGTLILYLPKNLLSKSKYRFDIKFRATGNVGPSAIAYAYFKVTS